MFVLQSPDEVLDWHQDWEDWIQEDDQINTSVWSISPDATLANDTIAATGFLTSVTVGPLTLGITYELKNTITTQFGLTGIREIVIRCVEQ